MYITKRDKPTPNWLGYLLSFIVILIIGITQCHSKELINKVEEKYINE